MAYSILSIARTLGRISGWQLSNLELQKMSYIAEMLHLGKTEGLPLVEEDFEAWANGPVVPKLYRAVKAFGAGPVKDVFYSAAITPDQPGYSTVLASYNQLKLMNPGQMVAMTHWRLGAWAKKYRPGARGVVIPKQMILDEYRARAR